MGFFARISRLIKGFFGLFMSGLESQNPEALLEAAKQEFQAHMAKYNLALARLSGIAERLKVQIVEKTKKAKNLEQRILANHQAGNLELAGSLARELQELKADLVHDSAELQETENGYRDNLRQARVNQKEFAEKVRKLEKQISLVKIKEAQAEAAAALNGAIFSTADIGDTMKTVEEVLNKRYEISAGKARVAKDLVDEDQLAEKEAERKALEQVALAEFLTAQGISSSSVLLDRVVSETQENHKQQASAKSATASSQEKEIGLQ